VLFQFQLNKKELGIGKSALVHALTNNDNNSSSLNNSSLEAIEVFIPETDICIIDTAGYGAVLRVNITFI
jgi:GTP-binding protein EngB required for normal cell division